MASKQRIFVGRKVERDQFEHELGNPSWIDQNVLKNPGRGVTSRVFLPHGVGGIGKSELIKQCLTLAERKGWQRVLVDWDARSSERPNNRLDMLERINAECVDALGEGVLAQYTQALRERANIGAVVQRYRTQHAAVWQAMLDGIKALKDVDPEPFTKVGLGILGGALDLGPKGLAKLADELSARQVISAQQAELLLRPETALARALVRDVREHAGRHGLVLAFDTCELLALPLEEFLRDEIVCPAVQGTTGLLVLVSGRYSQAGRRMVETTEGRTVPTKGYSDFLDEPPVDWNLSLFSEKELGDYLRETGFEPRDDLIHYLQETARGVPFAVQLLVSALSKLGEERLRNDFPPEPETIELQGIMQQVVQRFLSYCLTDATDLGRVQAMAMLRERDDEALGAAWGLGAGESVSAALSELQAKYGFIQSNWQLHEVVAGFLQQSLRSDDPTAARRIGERLAPHFRLQWEMETRAYATLGEQLAEPRWRRSTSQLLSALCWSNEAECLPFLAARALEAVIFNLSFAEALVASAEEFWNASGWWSERSRRRFALVRDAVLESDEKEAKALDALELEAEALRLDTQLRCLIGMIRADHLRRQGRLREALDACRAAEALAPDDRSVREELAERYAAVGRALGFRKGVAVISNDGLLAFERAIALKPDVSWYYTAAGALCNELNKYAEGMAYCTKAIELDDRSATAYNNRGTAYFGHEKYELALADYSKALDLDPRNVGAYRNRALAFVLQRKYPEALADLDHAIALDDKYALALASRGETYRRMDKYPEALADLDRAIALDDKYAQALASRGETYRLMGKYPEALADFDRAIALDDKYALALAHRGETYRQMGKYPEAIADLDRAIALDDKNTFALGSRGDTYRQMGNYPKALADYDRAIALDNKLDWVWANRGETYRRMGKYPEALADLDRAIALNDKYAFALGSRGETYRQMGKYPEALADFDRTIALNDKFAWALARRGETYRQMGKYPEALADFDRTIALNDKYAWALAHRGDALEALKRHAEAVRDYLAAIEIEPGNAVSHGNLAGTYLSMGRLAEAKGELEQRLRLAPENPFRALVMLAQVERLAGGDGTEATCTQALEHWEQAVAAGWQSKAGLLEDKALATLLLGRKEEALATLREAIAATAAGDTWDTEEWEQLKWAPVPPDGVDEAIALVRAAGGGTTDGGPT